jgi:hypothetical protein
MRLNLQKTQIKRKSIQNYLYLLLFTLLFQQISNAQNAGDNIFSGIQVHTINLKFSQANYWDSLVYYYNRGLEELMPISATVNGVAYTKIGVRLKGNSSFTYPGNKKSFKLNFDEYVSDARWDGEKAVHLNNMWGDPSFMREKMYLDFCRDAGITAPRANYVKLYINDTLWGLYSLIEHVDKTFLQTRFGNKNGDLFKAGDAFDASGNAVVSDFCYYGSADSSYKSRYELKTDGSTTAWPALISFCNTLNSSGTPSTDIPSKLNVTSYYKALATDVLFSNLDSYINSGRNFYTYFPLSSGKIEWVIWDVGLCFGAYPVAISKQENLSVTYIINSTDRPLVGKVYSTAELKNAYLQTLNTLFGKYFTTTKLTQHVDSIAGVIRTYVSEDPKKMYTLQQFETNISSDVTAEGGGSGASRKPGIKSFIAARVANITTQLTNLGILSVKGTGVPSAFSLSQNYPNPFNPSTTISFNLPEKSRVNLKIYDIFGREVNTLINEEKPAGYYSINFDASSLSSGTYLYRLSAGKFIQTKRMTLVK